MFHSEANKELDLFLRWRNDVSHLAIHLIKGNHDILKANWYTNANINVHPEQLAIGDVHFQHDLTTNNQLQTNNYTITGHIHPGVLIKGTSKQSLRFPCFYFGKQHGVLPAFSRFTGLAAITPKKSDSVYAIVNQSVIKV
jgi:uncharacterized protein